MLKTKDQKIEKQEKLVFSNEPDNDPQPEPEQIKPKTPEIRSPEGLSAVRRLFRSRERQEPRTPLAPRTTPSPMQQISNMAKKLRSRSKLRKPLRFMDPDFTK